MRSLLFILLFVIGAAAQMPPIGPGVSQELAKWRAARYSDVRYKLNLTLEKMSPVLKGTIEIRVRVLQSRGGIDPIILDWRKLPGHEKDSTVTNITLNEIPLFDGDQQPMGVRPSPAFKYYGANEHLVFSDGVASGENVIKLDFTSPILTSGSAITRYVDKEDGAEYIYSLFVPSDASTAFPVFDQPDLKAKFSLKVWAPNDWKVVSNNNNFHDVWGDVGEREKYPKDLSPTEFSSTRPISTYVFAFAAGDFALFGDGLSSPSFAPGPHTAQDEVFTGMGMGTGSRVYVRKSQAAKFKPHAAEVFRLTREGIKYLETYFDYKFPWPKYDLVLIPEFPFGGMEHAGATFLRESSVIFPTEPTKGDYISRANLIFHETAHQWFGDLVTMKWFDDLWLKEGFAEFMAYKTLEKVMPEANAWKVFYERNKQAAYATDSTKGTTPIYQEIKNLSAAKSAYGNIVYRKAPSFLRQAEFYLGEDKFQTAVRAFLKKHEYANAGWEDLVKEFQEVGIREFDPPPDDWKAHVEAEKARIRDWASTWVNRPGLPKVMSRIELRGKMPVISTRALDESSSDWQFASELVWRSEKGPQGTQKLRFYSLGARSELDPPDNDGDVLFAFPNYGDYGYGIFLLDDKSRDYVLKHVSEEKDPFLRSMMWGALWDSVREAELDPKDYVELAIKNLSVRSSDFSRPAANKKPPEGGTPSESDETIIASVLGRVGTAMNYYVSTAQATALAPRLENVLLDRLQHAPTAGQRITFYRAFVSNASTAKGREVLKQMLAAGSGPAPLRTKDKFDIVTRLAVLGDPDAPKLLAGLEKTETSDDAKRYAYAAHAAFGTAENKAKFWNDFLNNKDISESWIEAAMAPFNSVRHNELTLPYLEKALAELPNLKRNRKIFFVNGWLGAFIGGQRSEAALAIVNKFLADNPNLDNDLRLKVLENVDLIERAVKIRTRWNH